ncbi:MAG: DUF6020 family protein [Lachnospiraceae bacterium]|nr:DUF6020 family protein [Lachnospiraceae bacterium]
MSSTRNRIADLAKGISIILMVIDHVVMKGSFITSFHMPIFFIIAGYFLRDESLDVLVFKKAKGLLKPYFFMGIFTIAIGAIRLISFYDYSGLDAAQYSLRRFCDLLICRDVWLLWFLVALFLAEVIYIVIYKISKDKFILRWVLVILCNILGFILGKEFSDMIFRIDTALVSVVFVAFGHELKLRQSSLFDEKDAKENGVKKNGIKENGAKKNYIKNVLVMIACIVVWLMGISQGGIVLALRLYPAYPLCIISAIAGSVVVIFACGFLVRFSIVEKILGHCGRETLPIFGIMNITRQYMPWIDMVNKYGYVAMTIIQLCLTIIAGICVKYLRKIMTLKVNETKLNKIKLITEIFVILAWLGVLQMGTGFFACYLVSAIVAIIAHGKLTKEYGDKPYNKLSKKTKVLNAIVTLVFALSIPMSNYGIIEKASSVEGLIRHIVLMVGGFIIFWEILTYACLIFVDFKWPKASVMEADKSKKYFAIAAASIFVVHILYLFLCKYPGQIQYDTVDQIHQIFASDYNNHAPVWHTFIIKAFLNLGNIIGGDINTGILLFAIMQVTVFALVVAYAMVTLYESGVNRKIWIVTLVVFIAFPCHLAYGSYLVKDMLFSYMMFLYVIAYIRIIKNLGTCGFNYLWLIVGAIGFGVLRNNGWLVLAVTTMALLFIKSSEKKKIFVVSLIVLALTYTMKGPVLDKMNIPDTEFSEGLSIPIQQVARVVKDERKLTEKETEQIEALLDLEIIKDKYVRGCSDNMKGRIQAYGRDDYFRENKGEYLMLWIDLGLKYPDEYIKAFVDETVGYWDAGHRGTTMSYKPYENDIGVEQHIVAPKLNKALNAYFDWSTEIGFLGKITSSSGRWLWVSIIVFMVAFYKKNDSFIVMLPPILLIITLLMASPLASEVRYAYGLYCILPFMLSAMHDKQE